MLHMIHGSSRRGASLSVKNQNVWPWPLSVVIDVNGCPAGRLPRCTSYSTRTAYAVFGLSSACPELLSPSAASSTPCLLDCDFLSKSYRSASASVSTSTAPT